MLWGWKVKRKRVRNRLWRAYSEPRSRSFWTRVNALPPTQGERIYKLGCELQELESKVLYALKLAEQEQPLMEVIEGRRGAEGRAMVLATKSFLLVRLWR